MRHLAHVKTLPIFLFRTKNLHVKLFFKDLTRIFGPDFDIECRLLFPFGYYLRNNDVFLSIIVSKMFAHHISFYFLYLQPFMINCLNGLKKFRSKNQLRSSNFRPYFFFGCKTQCLRERSKEI